GPKSSRIAHANNGVSWQGLECPNGKRMSLESILNFGATSLSSPGPNTLVRSAPNREPTPQRDPCAHDRPGCSRARLQLSHGAVSTSASLDKQCALKSRLCSTPRLLAK